MSTVTINGNEYDEEVVEAGRAIIQNARGVQPTSGGIGGADISSDGTITRRLGQQYGGERDVYKVLGYPDLDTEAALEQYRARYKRQDIARRVVDAFPRECWKKPPKIVDDADGETEFQRVATRLVRTELTSWLRRVDRAQRLGEYGIGVIGVADGQPLEEPVNEAALSDVDDLSFLHVFPQEQVEDWTLGKEADEDLEPTHERYNKPIEYLVDFGDIDAESTDADFQRVHWTRVVPHAAEGALETDLKGSPALEPIFNRLIDREKVIGASAEMFYTGADRKLIANLKDDFALQKFSDTGERENFKEQLSRVVNDLQQTMVSTGMEFEVLGGEEVDPSGVVDNIDSSIASAVGMPKNKLQGNEQGDRATSIDRLNWFDNIGSRQTNFCSPQELRPTLDRLLRFGMLPEPEGGDYAVEWPELQANTADVQQTRATSLQAAGLAMSLTPEQRLDYLEGGPEAVTMDTPPEDPVELPEETSAEQEAFNDLMEQQGPSLDTEVDLKDSVVSAAEAALQADEEGLIPDSCGTGRGTQRAEKIANRNVTVADLLTRDNGTPIPAYNTSHAEDFSGGAEETAVSEWTEEMWSSCGNAALARWGAQSLADVRWWQRTANEFARQRDEDVPYEDVENVTNATRYGEGDTVSTPRGVGVVTDVLTETVETDERTVEASDSSPTYVVLVEDGRVGIETFKASDLKQTDFNTSVDNPTGALAENYDSSQAILDRLADWLSAENTTFQYPESWRESDTPARVIALDAFASMGGSFDGCVREMSGDIRNPEAFCGDFMDRLVGNEFWRGDSFLPGD